MNFNLENIEELIRIGQITWPIKIKEIGTQLLESDRSNWAVIHDERIPDDWFQDNWCEICCPQVLLPIHQRDRHERQEACGAREVRNGTLIIDTSKLPRINS